LRTANISQYHANCREQAFKTWKAYLIFRYVNHFHNSQTLFKIFLMKIGFLHTKLSKKSIQRWSHCLKTI